ncbi:hypothetical protein EV193_101706 [Herbihabitans rhizosphaerae]|uniref:Uncharacterized protein n=1 Tax=Herbihabitans rhizosphaerae TaxID=1872711 RepID=A0A4Q7L6D9_9PSEU|nr:hypothetical protein [Herbihabitans rhizosphaerae]RZS44826.1 hypothetical protein EV193_101706 [Herbihabitans rhizosphaerae]
MRRLLLAAVVLLSIVLAGAPAQAEGDPGPWKPAPQPVLDYPANTVCAFPVRAEPIVDEVVFRVLESYPDGKPKLEEYKGKLIDTVTRADTGAVTTVDISGHAFIHYPPSGGQQWAVSGPVLVGIRPGQGTNIGLWVFDGPAWGIDISPTGHKTIIGRPASLNTCDLLG